MQEIFCIKFCQLNILSGNYKFRSVSFHIEKKNIKLNINLIEEYLKNDFPLQQITQRN